MITDHHAWCVDEKGNVNAYPDNQLISGKYGATQVVRRPWDAHLVVQALLFIEKLNQDIFFDKNTHVLQDEFEFRLKMSHSLCHTVLPG